MIKSGVDIVYNKRFEKLINNGGFLRKAFQPFELKNKKKLAGIFALKEAVMKALGKKVDWHNIEIKVKDGKKSEIVLNDKIKPLGFKGIDGSISHDGNYTVGFVVMEL